MHPFDVFDLEACDDCATADPAPTVTQACCPWAVLRALESRGASLLSACASMSMDPRSLAELAADARVSTRDPLGVPFGWRLYNGRFTSDPDVERAIASGTLGARPADHDTQPSEGCDVRSGLVLAAREVAAGRRGPHGVAVSVDAMTAGTLVLGVRDSVRHWTSNAAAAHHVTLQGNHREPWFRGRTCPTALSPAADVLQVGVALLTRDHHLVRAADAELFGTGCVAPEDAGVDVQQMFHQAAVRNLRADAPGLLDDGISTRLVAVARDLAQTGRPVAVGVAVIGLTAAELAGDHGIEVTALRGGDELRGELLQAAAATTSDLSWTTRGILDVAGTAIKEDRAQLQELARST